MILIAAIADAADFDAVSIAAAAVHAAAAATPFSPPLQPLPLLRAAAVFTLLFSPYALPMPCVTLYATHAAADAAAIRLLMRRAIIYGLRCRYAACQRAIFILRRCRRHDISLIDTLLRRLLTRC